MPKSFARFTAFQRGRIVGQAEAGEARKNIRKSCRKKDGRSAGMRAIDAIIAHAEASENSSAGGRPRELTKQEEAKLQKLIVDEVGLARVTIPYCKKRRAGHCQGTVCGTLAGQRPVRGSVCA